MSQTLILGGGPAGLTAAYELGRLGFSGTVLEKGGTVGGLSRTVVHNGYRFDLGGHRFFSKDPDIEALWEEMLGPEMLERRRLSRIYYRDTFFDYPLRPSNALASLGPIETVRIGVSYVFSQLFPTTRERTFEEWVVNRFGRRLFEIFFKSYTEKVWGMPCSEIGADWASQRIKNLDLSAAVRNALLGAATKRGEVVTTLIDRFRYPRLGPGMMWERFRDRADELGFSTLVEHDVTGIEHNGEQIVAVQAQSPDGPQRFEASQFVSSVPMRSLIRMMSPSPPPEVQAAAEQLRYRDFLTVVLIYRAAASFEDNWIYIHSPKVRLGRVQNFGNWSPDMVPDPATSSLGLEYFVNKGDDLWEMSDADLAELGASEMEELGLARSEDVIDHAVVRVPKAYPVYDEVYSDAVGTIRDYVERFANLQLIGRNGQHRYNNQDHSMITGLLAARNISGESHDVWSVNTEKEYLEGDASANEASSRGPLGDEISRLFARYDPKALGGAVGIVSAVGLFLATAILLLKGGDPVGPTLSLLGHYLIGFKVTWTGAVVGFFEAGILGYIFGYCLASLMNVMVDFMARRFVRQSELLGLFDSLTER